MTWERVAAGVAVAAAAAGGVRRLIRAGEAPHQVNWGGRWINRIDGWLRLFCRHYHRLPGNALHLPGRGGAIVVANYVSGLDPLLLIAASRRPLRFLIARERYERFGLTWLFRLGGCIAEDRVVRPQRALREALRALRAGEVVTLFPHGAIHADATPPLKEG